MIGDPRQLRFVSFVPDRDVAATITANAATGVDATRRNAHMPSTKSALLVAWRAAPRLDRASARRSSSHRPAIIAAPGSTTSP